MGKIFLIFTGLKRLTFEMESWKKEIYRFRSEEKDGLIFLFFVGSEPTKFPLKKNSHPSFPYHSHSVPPDPPTSRFIEKSTKIIK